MLPAPAVSRVLAVQALLDAVERDHVAPRALFDRLTIGQSITAQVNSYANGIALVSLEGQTVAMRLPYPVKAGDSLKLNFAGQTPRAMFLLEMPDTPATDSAELSPTARLLSEILQRVPAQGPPTVTPVGPLFVKPPAHVRELASALRTALVRSGLFYESHLASWFDGHDSLDGLLQEPQNRLANPAAQTASLHLSEANIPSTQASPLHTLISQQLQVLEAAQIVWRGELWPGHALEWQLRGTTNSPDDEPSAPTPVGDAAVWESLLKLELPRLGTLTILIQLNARQDIQIEMTVNKAGIDSLLRHHESTLTDQLSATGCALRAITVKHNEHA